MRLVLPCKVTMIINFVAVFLARKTSTEVERVRQRECLTVRESEREEKRKRQGERVLGKNNYEKREE